MSGPYDEIEFTGVEIGEIVHTITELHPDTHPMLMLSACLSLALLCAEPDLKGEDISKGVRELSEWIALYTDNCIAPVPHERAN